jgi:DNA invertase Pin-like site-specific DNA recombinase
MILRAGLMKRVSTEEQASFGDSLQAQEEALVAYCNANNIKIVKIYSDEGFSARKPVLKRPAMLELLEDVKAGKLDIILFTKLDRWFRNVKEYHKIQEILERNKVVWKAILEDYNTATADGRLKVNIMLSVAENEADRTSERIKFVFNSKIMRKEAIFPNHNAPFGYKVIPIDGVNKVVKNEETREATEYFFKTALVSSARQAAIKTNQEFGLNRNYKSWNVMCHNEIYAGIYHGVENYCEPYITHEQYKVLSDFTVSTRKAKHNRYYLFSGLIRCNCCGNRMAGRYCTGSSGVEYYYYRCRRTLVKSCPSTSISEKKTEAYLLQNINAELEKYIVSVEAKQSKPKKKTDTSKLKEQLRRVNVSYQAGNMEDDEYLAKTKEIKALIEKATIEDEPTSVDVQALREFLDSGFEKIYDALSQEEKQRLWRSIVSELIYDGDEIVGIKFKG